ncbi:flavin reductase family protein [Streptomyces sp. NPDC046862]|uniref:flavin reductase family protein n=1 Tax=Streptomyces sp. NPDC046862 TaxID=3154603 RepID=UPI0034556DDF
MSGRTDDEPHEYGGGFRERLQAGTHTIFVCRVVDADVGDRTPMIYSSGGFFDGGALTALR